MNIRSMKGRIVDMAKLVAQNETAIAIGNAKMNARGDLLGRGGEVIKKKEQVAQEYHKANPNAVKRVSLKSMQPDTFLTPDEAINELKKLKEQRDAEEAPKEVKAEKPAKRKIIDSDE